MFGRRLRPWNCRHAHCVRCPPRGRVSGFGRPCATRMDDPHAHCVRCPPRGLVSGFGRPCATDMSAIPSSALPPRARGRGDWEATAQSLRRAALAVARADSPDLFGDFIRQLTEDLDAAAGFLAIFDDPQRRHMRSLAARLDGQDLEDFTYDLAGT